MLVGSSQYDGETILIDDPVDKGEPFDGDELQPGVEREGWIAYQVNGNPSASDARIAWSEQTFTGTVSVNWQSNP